MWTTTPRSPSTIARAAGGAHRRGPAALSEAGYSAHQPLRFELRYNAGEVHTKLALAIASMWKEALGVYVRLTAVDSKSLLQDIDRGTWRCSARAGSATTTTPTLSRST